MHFQNMQKRRAGACVRRRCSDKQTVRVSLPCFLSVVFLLLFAVRSRRSCSAVSVSFLSSSIFSASFIVSVLLNSGFQAFRLPTRSIPLHSAQLYLALALPTPPCWYLVCCCFHYISASFPNFLFRQILSFLCPARTLQFSLLLN